jgi:hypothetical protein
MNAAAKPIESPIAIPAIDIFRERCEARATLVEACLFDLQDAVDGLQEAAIASGLVDDIGQDACRRYWPKRSPTAGRETKNRPDRVNPCSKIDGTMFTPPPNCNGKYFRRFPTVSLT